MAWPQGLPPFPGGPDGSSSDRGDLDWVVTGSLWAHASLQEAQSEPLSEERRGRHVQPGMKYHSFRVLPAGAPHLPDPSEARQDCAYSEGRRGGGQGPGIRLGEEKEMVWEDGSLRMWGGQLAMVTGTL